MLDPPHVFHELMTGEPVRLNELPEEHGIYALRDHEGNVRYVGITESENCGFRNRIFSRHVTGSEGRSHKFSHAYNTGRMWRSKNDKSTEAKIAKDLRTAFIRRHCRATYFTVPPQSRGRLTAIEREVQALAPAGALAWGDKRSFVPLAEPTLLVDALIDDLRFSTEQRAAVERQARQHAALRAL
jgi:hypothetical protein